MFMEENIGIFDSGIGGVTVFKEILKVLPKENYIYYSDSKNNPYGGRDDETVKRISDSIVKFLIEKGSKAIVIACNTASAKAAQFLRDKYSNIPIIAIEPAYKMVYDFAYNDSTLVMATVGTIESDKFKKLYNNYNNKKTILLPCNGLAELIENEDNDEIWKYLEKNVAQYKGMVKNVVLGCTHYPLIKSQIRETLGDVRFFDGSESLANHLKKVLVDQNKISFSGGKIEFFDSQKSKIKEKRFWSLLQK